MKAWSLRIALVALLLSVMPAAADVTYVYVGNNFTNVSNQYPYYYSYTTSYYVTAYLTFSNPLAAGMAFQTVTPIQWQLTDHSPNYTLGGPSNLTIGYFSLATDASGNIVQWSVEGYTSTQGGGRYVSTSNTSTYTRDEGADFNLGYNVNSPGSWSVQPVPEPCTLALAGIGSAVAVVRARKRKNIHSQQP